MFKTIPKSVRDLLKHPWLVHEKYRAFESVFDNAGDSSEYRRKRRLDPSFYIYREDDRSELRLEKVFNHAEATAFARELEDAGARVRIRTPGENITSINEHVQHALSDFMSDTYRAWAKFNKSVAVIEMQGAPLATLPEMPRKQQPKATRRPSAHHPADLTPT